MKRLLCVAACLLLLPVSRIWSQRSSYDPAAPRSAREHGSFVDFTLKQINPQNTDYGCRIEEARKLAVDGTVKNVNSWAVLVALSFLVSSFLMLLHQDCEQKRREVMAAGFLAQYHNAWVDARAQAELAIRRHNQLVDATSNAAEAPLRLQWSNPEPARAGTVSSDLSRHAKPRPALPSVSKDSGRESDGGRTDSAQDARSPVYLEPEVDLIAQISTLQQQLNASHEREKNLQRELSKRSGDHNRNQQRTNVAG